MFYPNFFHHIIAASKLLNVGGGEIILLILCKIFQFLLVWRLRGIFISFHCGDFLWSTGMLISCSVLALWGHSREKLSYFTCKLPWGFSCNCNRWQPKRCSWKSTNKSQCRRWRTRQTSYCCHRLASCRNNGEIIKVYCILPKILQADCKAHGS